MRLVDTSAWIEWLVEGPAYLALSTTMPSIENWLLPTIVQLEITKWVIRQRNPEKSIKVSSFAHNCIIAPLDSKIALFAAELCTKHKLATADAIIYATALGYGADLLTCDAHFEGLDGVIYIPKLAP